MNKHFYIKKIALLSVFCFTLFEIVASTTPRWRIAYSGSKDTDYYKAISVIDDDTVYAISSSSKVVKTTDGGVTWTEITLPKWDTGKQPRAISFPSARIGYVAGDNRIMKTVDYGKTWTTLSYAPATNIYSSYAKDEMTCYFGGIGVVYYTTDGGVSFMSSAAVGAGASYVVATPNGTVFRSGANGGIYKSVDGAATFSANISTQYSSVGNVIPCLYFSDDNTGYAVGLNKSNRQNNLIKTTDGGGTWTAYSLDNVSTVATKGPNAVCIPTVGDGYVVGTISNAAGDIYIKKTTDAGASFVIDTIGAKTTDYYGISVTPRGDVYVGGNGCVLVRKIVDVVTNVIDPQMGSVTGAGTYYAGEEVVLNATANAGYVFEKWTDGTNDLSTDPTYKFTAKAATYSLNAVFASVTSVVSPENDAVVTVDGNNIKYHSVGGKISVYDTTGRLVVSQDAKEGVISVEEKGIYIVKLGENRGIRVKKVIIR